jgi:hypothetical protein
MYERDLTPSNLPRVIVVTTGNIIFMAENEYEYLEQALPGFTKARLIVKAAGDSIRPLGFKGSKFELSADRPRSGILSCSSRIGLPLV